MAAVGHYNRGVVLLEEGQLDSAIVSFRKAIELNDELPEAHNILGFALTRKGELDEAIASLRKAIELNDEFPEAHMHLGIALVGKGEPDEAIASFRTALELQPELPMAHFVLGLALKQNGELGAAIASLRTAVELMAEFPEAHYNLGLALKQEGQLDEAIASFRTAVQLKPQFLEAQLNLEVALSRKAQEAQLNLEVALSRKAQLDHSQGVALMAKGQWQEAVASLRQAAEIMAEYPEVHYNLGLALSRNGQLDEAIASFRAAIRLKFPFPQAQASLAESLARQGKITDAIVDYERARFVDAKAADPDSFWRALCWYASIWEHAAGHDLLGNPIDAGTACARAVVQTAASHPRYVDVLDSRGVARAQYGDFEGAIEDFEAFIAATSDDQARAQRQTWIAALRTGENPFTPDLLRVLRQLPPRFEFSSGEPLELGRTDLAGIFREAVVDEIPDRISCPALEYPRRMQQANIEGEVVLQFIVDRTGHVEPGSIEVQSSTHPAFEGPARDVFARCLFRPGRVRDRAVRVLVQMPIIFALQGRRPPQ